ALRSTHRVVSVFTARLSGLGFNSLRSMTWGGVHARPDLSMVAGDPWKVRVRPGAAERAEAGGILEGESGAASAPLPFTPIDTERLTEEILDFVRSIVESSDSAGPPARGGPGGVARLCRARPRPPPAGARALPPPPS